MRHRSILFIILLLPFTVFASCSEQGVTTVYVNGILTSLVEARRDLYSLKSEYYEKNTESDVNFINGYNPSHLAGFGDWIKSIEQAYKGSNDEPISDYDRDTILLQIYPEITTRKILLLGHSQGTFYTNALYKYLIKNGVTEKSISIYNLATPASFVAGNGNYLTSANDPLVLKVRELAAASGAKEPLPANILIPIPDSEKSDAWGGHHFSSDYLNGAPIRIISDIDNSLNKLIVSPSADKNGDCFIPPEKNISYKIQNVAFSVADPIANATYNGVSSGYNTALALAKNTYSGLASVIKIFDNNEITKTEIPPDIPKASANQGASVISAVEKPNVENIIQEPVQEILEPVAQNDVIVVPIQSTTTETSPTTTDGVIMPTFSIPSAGFGGGGAPPVIVQQTVSTPTVAVSPNSPTILVPSNFSAPFSSTTVNFSGTSDTNNIISTNFSSATTSSDSSGSWSLSLTSLPQATTTINFYATNQNNSTSTATTVSVAVLIPTPILPSQLTKDTVRSPIGAFQSEINQTLGNGLSGTTSSVTFSASASGFNGFFPALKLEIKCYTDSAYSNSCGFLGFSSATGILDNTQRDYTVNFSTPIVLSSSNYYKLHFSYNSSGNGGANSTSYYGSGTSTDAYVNGKCIAHDGNDCTVQSSLSDLYFILQ